MDEGLKQRWTNGVLQSDDAFWMRILHMRCILALFLAIGLGSLSQFGPHRLWFAIALAGTSAVQNLLLYRLVQRTGTLPEAVTWSDYAFGAVFGVLLPPAFPWMLIVLTASVAQHVVAYPRRVSRRLLIAWSVPFLIVGITVHPDGWIPAYLIFLISSFGSIAIIGPVADQERSLRSRHETLIEQLRMVVWESTGDRASLTHVNDALDDLLGHPRDLWKTPGFWESLVHPADRSVIETSNAGFAEHQSHDLEYRILTTNGEYRWVLEMVRIADADVNGAHLARGVIIDVSDRKRAEQRFGQLGQFVADLPLPLHILRLDDLVDPRTFRYVAMNRAASDQTGSDLEQMQTWTPGSGPQGVQELALLSRYAEAIRTGTPIELTDYERDLGGAIGVRRFHIRGTPLPDQAIGISIEDVTVQRVAAQDLRYQAMHDSLTGLPNRAMLHHRLTDALDNATISGQPVALLFMDLNQFKEVNDALGHHHGDRLLIELGKRLDRVVDPDEMVARLGGDEFAVVLSNGATAHHAIETAKRIAHSFEQPVEIDGITLQTNVSIGIALFPEHGNEADILTQRADVAMYTAKSTGVGVSLYSPESDRSSVRRLTLLSDLKRAADDDQFVVHYQPRIDLVTGDVMDVEALVRWEHPVFGLLPPTEFIELAEVSGAIQQLTTFVMGAALQEMAALATAGHRLGVAVNLSVRNLYDPLLLETIRSSLAASGLDPSRLRVEITESELMDDPALAMDVLGQIRAQGIEVSVDDFGTGYSSLAYLRNLPISEIKIDKSFVADLDRGDTTLVRSIIDLGHNLDLRVVAEGVESGPVLRQLADFNCDSAQGYFISKPVPLDELIVLLNRDGDHYRGWLPRRPSDVGSPVTPR